MGMGILFLPLYLVSTVIKDDNLRLKSEIESVQKTLAVTPAPEPTQQALRNTLFEVQGRIGAIEPVQTELLAKHVDWPAIMSLFGQFDQTRMSISSITQADNRVAVRGRGETESVVTNYGHMLEESGAFKRVIVESINLVALPTPTPLPTPTLDKSSASSLPLANAPIPTVTPVKVAEFSIIVELKVAPNERPR